MKVLVNMKVLVKKKYHINISFKWFDFWIGLFVDVPNKSLYVCLIPMFPIKIWITEHEQCPICNSLMVNTAYLDEGWILEWECEECGYCTEGGCQWMFGNETKTADDLKKAGFKIL